MIIQIIYHNNNIINTISILDSVNNLNNILNLQYKNEKQKIILYVYVKLLSHTNFQNSYNTVI